MNGRHKQRIAAMQDIAEAEFEEVNEDEQSAADPATEPKEPIDGTASSSNKFTWYAPTGGAGHGRCNPNPTK